MQDIFGGKIHSNHHGTELARITWSGGKKYTNNVSKFFDSNTYYMFIPILKEKVQREESVWDRLQNGVWFWSHRD